MERSKRTAYLPAPPVLPALWVSGMVVAHGYGFRPTRPDLLHKTDPLHLCCISSKCNKLFWNLFGIKNRFFPIFHPVISK